MIVYILIKGYIAMSYKRRLVGLVLCFQTACASTLPPDQLSQIPNDSLCAAEITCRKLTANEIALAKTVFADTIDYDRVRIIYRPYSPMRLFTHTMTPDGNIYVYSDRTWKSDYAVQPGRYYRGFIMHELMHAKQFQHGTNVHALGAQNILNYAFNNDGLYSYSLGRPFEQYGLEQQAQIVQDYIKYSDNAREDFRDIPDLAQSIWCKPLNNYAETLKVPLTGELAACNFYDNNWTARLSAHN